MDRIEAVQAAKKYARQLFSDEHISQVFLEEINFDADKDEWLVTISFAYAQPALPLTPPLMRETRFGDRQYKVVHIADQSGDFTGMTDRLLAPLP